RFPTTLSGGEARRVAIGRALLTAPRLLLMDEPLTGLDGARKQELLRYIDRLAREIDTPIVYVSHDPHELTAIADHLVLLEHGRIIAEDRLDALLNRFDLTEHLGGFDAASVIVVSVIDHEPAYALTHLALDDGQTLSVPALHAERGERLRLRIPVRDVALALSEPDGISYRNRLHAIIERIGPRDDTRTSIELSLNISGQALRTRLTRKAFDEMGLEVDMPIVALIRSVAFEAR
ncbi:TOBE domain-containing protein, partial [Halomonas sp. BBD48]|nr:TOBE domain-containing protein [Halomonas sp. BBD48]